MPAGSNVNGAPPGVASDLLLLAGEKSPEKRLELLRRITDVYLTRQYQSSPTGQYLFNQLVTELLNKIGAAGRANASAELSTQAEIPDFLAHQLATDQDYRVAEPMVRNYGGLSEHTLLTVARTGSQQHLRGIASRPAVTPPVSEIVVERGDQGTVRTLASNLGAQFSTSGMRKLIAKSEHDVDLQSLIVERADLTLEAAGILLPMISKELAARLRGRATEINQAALGLHVEEWMKKRTQDIARTEAYIDGIRSGDLTLENVAAETIKAKRLLDVTTVLAAMNDLDRDYAFDLLSRGTTESVLLVMRSMNLPWPLVEGFLRLRRTKMTPQRIERPAERTDYEAIDLPTAQRVVRFMKVRRAAMTQTQAQTGAAAS